MAQTVFIIISISRIRIILFCLHVVLVLYHIITNEIQGELRAKTYLYM